jgi:hypothetical protein
VLDLVATLERSADETVELSLSTTLASLITPMDAGDPHSQSAARTATVTVDRATAARWEAHAWRAVGEGKVAAAEAQHLSDQLTPRGAA